ncbi:serine/threonine-protein kinase [Micromonospora sp. KC606]|uniref:serine/threonine-protein kinase n=1 Tax=Micromonospora sp. KC606 TaxID=2530379 RepID=UPI002442C9FE|nr:serine/threonine-protein kinase [Micromonospora sp. KC606]
MTADWQLSGYTPVRQLGAGASGRVLLATHDASGVPVAIKYLNSSVGDDPAFRLAFREEAMLLVEVDDPHVSRLYEYAESPLGAAIVMELVNGVSLRQMLRAHGPTEPEAALCVLRGSLAGLAAAHARGVVHRDYKPENVLVDVEGRSKLADFGIAVLAGRGGGASVSGTPRYMAPEQWAGAPASPACDIYAATATFYECLTGHPPYDGKDLFTLRDQHTFAPVPLDPAPQPMHDLLRHGMAKRPADRPQSAHVFLAELERIAAAAYGEGWEEQGLRQLARRAALLAALFPFPDAAGGATSVATTSLGISWVLPRRGSTRAALLGSGLVAALLLSGAGLTYASRNPPALALVDGASAPHVSAPTSVDPTLPVAAPPITAVSPSQSLIPVPSPTEPELTVSPTRPQSATATPSRTRTVPPPPPSPPASTSPPPPADGTAPVVGKMDASPTVLYPGDCLFGEQSSTVTATASDDRSTAEDLRLFIRYPLDGVVHTVRMTNTGGNAFRGTFGDLPAPESTTRIPVEVVAVDAAGHVSAPAGPVHVSLQSDCPLG